MLCLVDFIVCVVDFDGMSDCAYVPVVLDPSHVLWVYASTSSSLVALLVYAYTGDIQ